MPAMGQPGPLVEPEAGENSDFLLSNEHHVPPLGQGFFARGYHSTPRTISTCA